jgi:cysteinyl-tRNA synthetase
MDAQTIAIAGLSISLAGSMGTSLVMAVRVGRVLQSHDNLVVRTATLEGDYRDTAAFQNELHTRVAIIEDRNKEPALRAVGGGRRPSEG